MERQLEKEYCSDSANKHNLAISSFDDAITNLGAIPSESGLEIPINSNLTEDVILEVATIAEGKLSDLLPLNNLVESRRRLVCQLALS